MGKAKKPRRFRLTLFLIFLCLASAGALILMVKDINPLDNISLTRREERSASSVLLTGVKEIFRLNTVEMISKVVFPYDYVPYDMDWQQFRRVETQRPLSLREQEYKYVYRLAREIGLELEEDGSEFMVITIRLKAGFNLDNSRRLSSNTITISDDNRVTVAVPSATITDIIIDDPDETAYGYPDMAITPEQWREISQYIQTHVLSSDTAAEALRQAEERGRAFIRQSLQAAGYKEVLFR